jgi:hypothetical protein
MRTSHRGSRASRERPIVSALKHCKLNYTVINLAEREPFASDTLERVPMLVEVAERLILCWKRRLETTHLPNRADREHKADRLPPTRLCLWHDPDTFGHLKAFSVGESSDPSMEEVGKGQFQACALFRKSLLSPRLCGRQRRFRFHFFGFPRLPQGAKPLHVLANRDGLLLHIRDRSRTFFRGQTLPVGARDTVGRGFG